MKILSSSQVRQWDEYTIHHEPVTSIDLMERAAAACFNWLKRNDLLPGPFSVFCGKGNNGGDGLALARMLIDEGCVVSVQILENGQKGSADFQINLQRLYEQKVPIRYIGQEYPFRLPLPGEIVIDALYGSGLNRPLEGMAIPLVEQLNGSGNRIISIDVPSGLFIDRSSRGNMIIKASHTLSFQTYKTAFLVPENRDVVGEIRVLDIGLHPDFYNRVEVAYELSDTEVIRKIYIPRDRFAHKGNFGHALLVAGSHGKMGAATLAAKACLRAGAGLLSCHIPGDGYEIMQRSVPEAMVITDDNAGSVTKFKEDIAKYSVIGIGPGMGTRAETTELLVQLLDRYKKPIVLDADGLNILAAHPAVMKKIPPGSILTPHPKEFERLFGETPDDFERLELALQKANELSSVIILKGHYSFIAVPGKFKNPGLSPASGFFNSTGNAGMATAGSGDVLTGILTGLLSQGYRPAEAAILGTYIHGLSGDIAARAFSMEGMTSADLVESLGKAWLELGV